MRVLYIVMMLTLPAIGWSDNFYLDLKEGCYKSTSYEDIMPLNAEDYKSWIKVTCNQPHHIEVFHVQRLARKNLDESTVSKACVSSYKNLFDKYPPASANEPGPYLRWFWPDDDEYMKYGSTIVCYLHAGDAGKYVTLKNKPNELFVDLIKKISIGLSEEDNSGYLITPEKLVSEAFRILPYNKDFMVFAQLYRFNVEENNEVNQSDNVDDNNRLYIGIHGIEEVVYDKLMYIVGLYKLSESSIVVMHNELYNEEITFIAKANSISIDTAPYQLNSNTRAFGVRINSAHQSWAGLGEDINNRLIFYIESDGKILKLLDMYTSKEEWQGMRIPGKKAEISLSIQDSTKNGFGDILLTAEITSWSNVLTRESYDDVEYRKTKERRVLTFNGSKYIAAKPPPWWLLINE